MHTLILGTKSCIEGEDAMRRYRRSRGGWQVCFVSFGVGLLACFLFPAKFVIAILGVALVLCGICDR